MGNISENRENYERSFFFRARYVHITHPDSVLRILCANINLLIHSTDCLIDAEAIFISFL